MTQKSERKIYDLKLLIILKGRKEYSNCKGPTLSAEIEWASENINLKEINYKCINVNLIFYLHGLIF